MNPRPALITISILFLICGHITVGHSQDDDAFSSRTSGSFTEWHGSSGMDSDSTSGYTMATYESFEGSLRGSIFTMQSGDTITVDYKVGVGTGQLRVELVRTNGVSLWSDRAETDRSISGQTRIPVRHTDRYAVDIVGLESRDGRFEITWRIVGKKSE